MQELRTSALRCRRYPNLIVPQTSDRRAEVSLRCVPEFDDQRMSFERLLHNPALDAFAPAMNQPHLAQSGFVSCGDVFLDD